MNPTLKPLNVGVVRMIRRVGGGDTSFTKVGMPIGIVISESAGSFRVRVNAPPAATLVVRRLNVRGTSRRPNLSVMGSLPVRTTFGVAEVGFSSLLTGSCGSNVGRIVKAYIDVKLSISNGSPERTRGSISTKGCSSVLLR